MTISFRQCAHLFAIAGFLVTLTENGATAENATAKLEEFHTGLEQRYPGVPHISPDQLGSMAREDLVFFDVREADEYGVSQIDRAIRVSPSIRASTFLHEHAAELEGKTVILYCSVGERSSNLAERVMAQSNGAKAVYNLEGGIFRWHNENRRVANSEGETTFIHPYSRRWGRLLERRDQIRMTPE